MNLKNQRLSRVYSIGTIVLWSSAFVLTKIALRHFSPPGVGVLRYLVASLFFVAAGLHRKIGLPAWRDVPRFLASGALGFTLYMLTFNHASRTLTSATGAVIIATAPVITALLANALFHEKIRAAGWLAIAVEFCGVLVLTLWEGVFSMNRGVFWMLAAAVCISGYNLFQRHLTRRYSALQSTAYNIYSGTFFMLGFLPRAAKELSTAPASQWAVLIFMGILPSAVAFLWWAKALRLAEKTSDVTNFMFVTPLLATLLGFLMIGEAPAASTYAGGAIILVGMILFQRANATDAS